MSEQYNKYQTQLTEDVLNGLNEEVKEELYKYINGIPLIQSLISKDRKRARDLPRRGDRIIVDIANPHIIEDMEYFRPACNHFKKYGVYTFLMPNANPESEFGKWIKEEINRIWTGMVRPSDGE